MSNLTQLNESTLGLLENNDPAIDGLIFTKSHWIKRAGRAIGDSTSLRRLNIGIPSREMDGTWLSELLRHLPRNRSIESLKVGLAPSPLSRYIYELEWDIFHELTPFIEHNSNLRNIELRWGTQSMLNSLTLALSTCKNKRLERIKLHHALAEDDYDRIFASLTEYNNLLEICVGDSEIGTLGCVELSKFLRNSESKIHKLQLLNNELDDERMVILSIGLMRSKSMKLLDLRRNSSATAKGWGAFSAILFHPTCTIEKLWLSGVDLNDEGVTYLGEALAVNKSAQYLDLFNNPSITNDGWREFFKCMRNPDSSLKKLDLSDCSIDDEGVATIMNALVGNVSLKRLSLLDNNITSRGLMTIFNSLLNCEVSIEDMDLRGNSIDFEELSQEDWRVLSRALYDKSSIDSTYSSNHTLFSLKLDYFENTEDWLDEVWSGIESLLSMNENRNKAQLARQKILEYHFNLSDEHTDTSVFAGMLDNALPNALEWIGRSRDIRTFSIMFNVFRGKPTLFDITNDPIIEGAKKRKLGDAGDR